MSSSATGRQESIRHHTHLNGWLAMRVAQRRRRRRAASSARRMPRVLGPPKPAHRDRAGAARPVVPAHGGALRPAGVDRSQHGGALRGLHCADELRPLERPQPAIASDGAVLHGVAAKQRPSGVDGGRGCRRVGAAVDGRRAVTAVGDVEAVARGGSANRDQHYRTLGEGTGDVGHEHPHRLPDGVARGDAVDGDHDADGDVVGGRARLQQLHVEHRRRGRAVGRRRAEVLATADAARGDV